MEVIDVKSYDQKEFAGMIIDQFDHPTWQWKVYVSYVLGQGIRLHTHEDLFSPVKSPIGRMSVWVGSC